MILLGGSSVGDPRQTDQIDQIDHDLDRLHLNLPLSFFLFF